MRYKYNSRLEFFIPHFVESDGAVIGYDYCHFKRELMNGFKTIGLNYYQILPMKEVIDGIEYDAEQIVVFCDESLEMVIIQEFYEICCRYHKEFGTGTFYYTHAGALICLTIGED